MLAAMLLFGCAVADAVALACGNWRSGPRQLSDCLVVICECLELGGTVALGSAAGLGLVRE